MAIVETVPELRKAVAKAREGGQRVALVPTMGALHAGHMALVEAAKKAADFVVVSIFINPKQFGPNEDFDTYPRLFEADKAMLEKAAVQLLYHPAVEAMYPRDFATELHVKKLESVLCGQTRPGHFAGVATVVCKLLMQAMPDVAVFGEKDYQQLAVIRRMVADLDMQVEILGVPTVREEDGLALSSRNRYLSGFERTIAPDLYKTLQETGSDLLARPDHEAEILQKAKEHLKLKGFSKVEYLSLVSPVNLMEQIYFNPPARLCVAAWLGKTRLIDNISVP